MYRLTSFLISTIITFCGVFVAAFLILYSTDLYSKMTAGTYAFWLGLSIGLIFGIKSWNSYGG